AEVSRLAFWPPINCTAFRYTQNGIIVPNSTTNTVFAYAYPSHMMPSTFHGGLNNDIADPPINSPQPITLNALYLLSSLPGISVYNAKLTADAMPSAKASGEMVNDRKFPWVTNRNVPNTTRKI